MYHFAISGACKEKKSIDICTTLPTMAQYCKHYILRKIAQGIEFAKASSKKYKNWRKAFTRNCQLQT